MFEYEERTRRPDEYSPEYFPDSSSGTSGGRGYDLPLPRKRYSWWSDPDNDPPSWMLDSNTIPSTIGIAPNNGTAWMWAGDHWEMRAIPNGVNGGAPDGGNNTGNTGNGGKTREQIIAEGREYDAKHGYIGGYFDEERGVWVNGSPYGGSGSGSGGGGKNGGGASGWQMAPYGGGANPFPMLSLPDVPELPTLERYADFVPEEWKAPQPSEIYDDPSYKFRFSEGMRPIETSRAAQGLTRTGATLKALSRYGQNFASNEYDRIYNRAADSYDRRNQSKYQAWAGNRQNTLDTYDRSRANVLDRYDRTVSKARDEYAPRARWAELQFGRDWDVYKYQQDDAFRKWAKEGDWANQLSTNYRPD
jgi:hypothetical protein